MKLLALVSGGKDSLLASLLSVCYGHEIVAVVNLTPQNEEQEEEGAKNEEDKQELDSFCFQTVGHQILPSLSKCMQLPLFRATIKENQSINTKLEYLEKGKEEETEEEEEEDEVEVMYRVLKRAKEELSSQENGPIEVQGVCSGAILSTYQRLRVERVCQRLKLQSFAYLWQRPAQNILWMLSPEKFNLDAILIKIASYGLKRQFLGKSLSQLSPVLNRLHLKEGLMHAAGEGGEFETAVLDCPALFQKQKLVRKPASEKIFADERDGEGTLLFQVEVVDKTPQEVEESKRIFKEARESALKNDVFLQEDEDEKQQENERENSDSDDEEEEEESEGNSYWQSSFFIGYCTSEEAEKILASISSPSSSTEKEKGNEKQQQETGSKSPSSSSSSSSCALNFDLFLESSSESQHQQTLDIFSLQQQQQEKKNFLGQILYTIVFGSNFSYFADVNSAYSEIFKRTVPAPSRAFVGCGDESKLRISVISLSSNNNNNQENSEEEKNAIMIDRRTLHVQSISCWAAACIGPYAQSQTLTCRNCSSSIILTAGTIGLEPASMIMAGSTANSRFPSCCEEKQLVQESIMLLGSLHAILQQSGSSQSTIMSHSNPQGIACAKVGTVFFAKKRVSSFSSSSSSSSSSETETLKRCMEIFEAAWKINVERRTKPQKNKKNKKKEEEKSKTIRLKEQFNILNVVMVESLPRNAAVEFVVGGILSEGNSSCCSCNLVSVALPNFINAFKI